MTETVQPPTEQDRVLRALHEVGAFDQASAVHTVDLRETTSVDLDVRDLQRQVKRLVRDKLVAEVNMAEHYLTPSGRDRAERLPSRAPSIEADAPVETDGPGRAERALESIRLQWLVVICTVLGGIVAAVAIAGPLLRSDGEDGGAGGDALDASISTTVEGDLDGLSVNVDECRIQWRWGAAGATNYRFEVTGSDESSGATSRYVYFDDADLDLSRDDPFDITIIATAGSTDVASGRISGTVPCSPG